MTAQRRTRCGKRSGDGSTGCLHERLAGSCPIYPVFGGRGLHPRDAKLAMGLTGTRGRKYNIEQIFPRHFFQTAKAAGFDKDSMARILIEYAETVDTVVMNVRGQLPIDFPVHISNSILGGLQARAKRLKIGWG